MKTYDTDPPFQVYLTETVNGQTTAVNLTNKTARFTMINGLTRLTSVNAPAVIEDAINGLVQYKWGPTDTYLAGDYLIFIHIIDNTSGVMRTFPDLDAIHFKIEPNYGVIPILPSIPILYNLFGNDITFIVT